MAYITLTHSTINSGTAVTVQCQQVNVSLKKNKQAIPNANPTNIVEVQTTGIENPIYSLVGVHFALADTTLTGGVLTYPQALSLLKLSNAPGSEVVMNVYYGLRQSEKLLPNYGLTLTGIKGVVTDVTYPIDVRDSKGGYMPVGTIMFTETL